MGFPHLMLEFFADQGVGRGAFDIDGEAVEFVADRLVSDLLEQRLQVFLPLLRVRDVQGPPVDFELPLRGHAVRNGIMDAATGVSQQVEGLLGAPHHAQIKLPVEEQRLHRRNPRPPILPQSSHHHQPMPVQPLLPQCGQLRVLLRKLLPGHFLVSESEKPRGISRRVLFFLFWYPGWASIP